MGWEEVKRISPETRRLLQVMGTEVGREMFSDDFWVSQAMRGVSKFDKIVFTDVRYPNEYKAIKLQEGRMLRLTKPSVIAVNDHSSESALDNHGFDGIIVNDGSIEELHRNIDLFMKEL
jgi:hypothetical protein